LAKKKQQKMSLPNKNVSILNAAVIVAALGYFVDIYDLLIVTIVKHGVLEDLGAGGDAMFAAHTKVLNFQMVGLLIGGILWGVLADKKGRLSVLFGSIIMYSIANFINGFVGQVDAINNVMTPVDQYAWLRFIAGIGLAGELGAGITLVSELLPKEKRGIGTSLVAAIGLSGAVAAYFVYQGSGKDWRLCFKIGGMLGILLLFLRIKVSESGMFNTAKNTSIAKGDFRMFFNNKKRFKKYISSIGLGLPTWYIIGILVSQSNAFAKALNGTTALDSGKAIMYAYVGISIADISIGLLSQYLKSRKKALAIFYIQSIVATIIYFSSLNNSDGTMYFICGVLGFSTGYWALFITMGAEQFGTNLRGTAATTIPNMVRGSLPVITLILSPFFMNICNFSLVLTTILEGVIVFTATAFAFWAAEETFHKDLDYIEE
jgi:MFS transporter, putative metabolite:H+ symporter